MFKFFCYFFFFVGLVVCVKWKMVGFLRMFFIVNLFLVKDFEVDFKLQYLDVCRYDICRKSFRYFNVLKYRDGKMWQLIVVVGDVWFRNS